MMVTKAMPCFEQESFAAFIASCRVSLMTFRMPSGLRGLPWTMNISSEPRELADQKTVRFYRGEGGPGNRKIAKGRLPSGAALTSDELTFVMEDLRRCMQPVTPGMRALKLRGL